MCNLQCTVRYKRPCVFFAPIDSSHYSVHKSIRIRLSYKVSYILGQNMSDLYIKYLVNNTIFGHVTLITFYADCWNLFT